MPPAQPARWKRGAERVIASTRILELRGVQFSNTRRGREGEFTVIATPDWVNVLALTPARRLVLVRQFRCGSNDLSLEIPGGVIEPGETPLAAAVRELREETGYEGGRPRLLGAVHPNPAIQNNRCHIALIENARPSGSIDWDDDEDITVETAPIAKVMGWARAGRITHSLVICGLFMLEQRLVKAKGECAMQLHGLEERNAAGRRVYGSRRPKAAHSR